MKIFLLVAASALLLGCTSLERAAYETVVGAKAFLGTVKTEHPECPAAASTLCVDLAKATAANNLLIDMGEAYCSAPDFENGGPCQPPMKGTPQFAQAVVKLKAALVNYNQIETDLRGVIQ